MAPLHLTLQEASYTYHHKVVGPFFWECPHPKALPYSTLCDVAAWVMIIHYKMEPIIHIFSFIKFIHCFLKSIEFQ